MIPEFQTANPDATVDINYDQYDKIIVAFSGGKDSLACLIYLVFVVGVPKEKIEIWHHKVDGDTDQYFMDYPCTSAYCTAVADAFDIPIYFSWKAGGFRREMYRENQKTAEMVFETPDGIKRKGGDNGKENTRLRFPQTTADLSVRWCSSYLKIDVCKSALRNQPRFRGIKTLVVTGERGQESSARSKYETFEPHQADLRDGKRYQRHIDHARPILHWFEADVWNVIEAAGVRVHPAYYAGINRVSCAYCIFESDEQLATSATALPEQFEDVASDEDSFDMTIKEGHSLRERRNNAQPYDALTDQLIAQLRSQTYNQNIFIGDQWELPASAFGDSSGSI